MRRPNSPSLRVTDGPKKDTYGYKKCVEANYEATLANPAETADCLLILAEGMFCSCSSLSSPPPSPSPVLSHPPPYSF